jgi:O-antigen ligase
VITSQPSTPWWSPVTPAATEQHGGSLPFAALMTFLFITVVSPQSWFPALASLRLAMLAAVVAAVGLLADRLARGGSVAAWTRETWLALGLFVWAVATVPFSYWPGGSVSLITDTYAKTLIVFWLLGIVVDTRERFRFTLWMLTLTAIPIAVTAVHHFMTGEYFPPAAKNEQRIMGYLGPLAGNPNDLALTLNLILPFTLTLLFTSRGRAVRLFLVGIAVVDAMAVVMTWSRAGFVTLATTLALTCWRLAKRGRPGWAVAMLVLALVAVPLFPAGYVDRLATMRDIDDDPTHSAQTRWSDTIAAAEFVLAHPLAGAGAGQNILALNEQRGAKWKMVHNVYLEYAVDLGLPGLVLFLLILYYNAAAVRRVRRLAAAAEPSGELVFMAEGLQTSLVAFSLAGIFHPVAYHPYFYYIAGLGVAMQTMAQRWPDTTSGS